MLSWLFLILLPACDNPCVDYCKELDAWLADCGTTWETEFEEKDWESVQDCFDHHWEADDGDRKNCGRRIKKLSDEECY